jgi:ATP-dependent Clp protease ATP-binding subunit ClpA
MFERYTEGARRTIFFARYEALQVGSADIETEHILLGLLREDKALFRRVLSNVEYESIHKDVVAHTTVPRGRATAPSADLPLSNESKRVLAFGAEEAERLTHLHIGTEHLLLGLLREEKHPAGKLLRQRGADLGKLRLEISKLPTAWFSGKTAQVVAPSVRTRTAETVEIHALNGMSPTSTTRSNDVASITGIGTSANGNRATSSSISNRALSRST